MPVRSLMILAFLGALPARLPAQSPEYPAALEALHAELGERYPFFELKGIDWPAVGKELLPRARRLRDQKEFGLLVMEMVARLEDSNAQVLPGSAKLPELDLPRFEPGCACLLDDRARPVVYWLYPRGPAESSGIRVGMTLLRIEGKPVEKLLDQERARLAKLHGYSSDRARDYDAVRQLLRRSEKGDSFRVLVEEPRGRRKTVRLRATEPLRYLPRLPVQSEGIDDNADVSHKWLDEERKLGYLYLRRVSRGVERKLESAMATFYGLRGLIIDVRGNSGGGFDQKKAFRPFDPEERHTAPPPYTGPIAVLIDARTIGAAEVWASWFVPKQRARFFGQTTAGAFADKDTWTLPGGLYQVRFPIRPHQGFLDRPIERRGLEPDVPLLPHAADLAEGRDTVLLAAQKWLAETAAGR